MTITTDPAKDYVISGFLPEGDQLVETSVSPDIWTRRPSSLSSSPTGLPAGTIRLTAFTPWLTRCHARSIVIENQKQGSLELTKTGDILGEKDPLSGVTFKLYRNETGDPEADCVSQL